jgi:restriction endonuclease S subunit
VLFGKLRPYLAKCIIAGFDGVCSSEILVLRGFVGNVSYLQNILLSYNLIYYINASTYGAKMPRASWNFIGNCAIPLPPLDEQQSIVNYLEKKSESTNRLISGIETEIHLAQEYKSCLISEVVTGKIDIRDVKIDKVFESVTMEETEAETEEVIEE